MNLEEQAKESFEKKGFDLKMTCRSCLISTEDVQSIFNLESPLAEQIWECTEVRVSSDDGLPTGFCPNCLSELAIAHTFRMRCRHSDVLLRHFKNNFEEIEVKSVLLLKEKRVASVDIPNSTENDLVTYGDHNVKVEVNIKCEDDDFDNFLEEDNSSDNKLNVKNLTSHYQRPPKKFSCNICSKLLSSKGYLKTHMKNIHNVKSIKVKEKCAKYKCSECPYRSTRSQSLLYHMRTHTGEKPYKCDVCDSCFAQPGTLIEHKKTHSDKMYFTCEECGKQFKYRTKYNIHKLVHSKIRKYVCDICHKALRSKTTLVAHLNRHYNIKNFSCETCGTAFVTSSELINHARKHVRDLKYECHLCNFKSHLKASLEKHLLRHTGEKSFNCDMCDFSCYTKGHLRSHIMKHTKEKNYSCDICETRFVHSHSVIRHMLHIHNVKYNRVVDRRYIK